MRAWVRFPRTAGALWCVAFASSMVVVVGAPPGGAGFPGQNGRIAFTRQPVSSSSLLGPSSFQTPLGAKEIYTVNPDGTGQAKLSSVLGANDTDPAWSPDGSKIAFATDRDDDVEIYLMGADGSNPARLTQSPGFDGDPAWSPDGTKIAFVRLVANDFEIFVANANGSGTPVNVTGDPGADFDPNWSPDGARIAFMSTRDGNTEIYLTNADGSGSPKRLTTDPVGLLADDRGPNWSPDGVRIAFSSNRTGNDEIHVINADGSGTPVNVTRNPGRDVEPAWSPDGARIAFASNRVTGAFDVFDVFVTNADGTGTAAPLTTAGVPPSVDSGEPDWQPLRPAVKVEPPSIGFPAQQVGSASAPQTVTVTSVGNGTAHVSSVTIAGPHAGDFPKGPDTCQGASLPPGASCKVTVAFGPTAPGSRAGEVRIASDAPGSPHSVPLSGTGTEQPTPTPSYEPRLALDPPIGPPGFVTQAVGAAFPPAAEVRLTWEEGLGETRVTADAAGAFRVPLLIFHRDRTGPRELVASGVSGPSFTVPRAPFLVVQGSVQPGQFVLRR